MTFRRVFLADSSRTRAMPPAELRRIIADEAPQLRQLDERPVAVGTKTQVHRAVWPDGRAVAVKVQLPDADTVLRDELERARLGFRALRLALPGHPVAPLWEEFREHAATELDRAAEATHQRAFALAYRDDPDILVPDVRLAGPRLLVTDWVAGEPVTEVIAAGVRQRCDQVAGLVTAFQLSAPARAGLVHANPASDTFRVTPDGRLAVLDFGAVAAYPDGLPREFGRLLRAILDRDADGLDAALRELDAVGPRGSRAPRRLLALAETVVLPVLAPDFRLDRHWLRRQAGTLTLSAGVAVALGVRLPPGHLPLLRTVVGTVHLFCRLNAQVDYATALATWLPGFARG
ncbi:AarF/UbiB family protein [Micromonospora sp. WMMD1120]|uniref:AarF/UbiB family protein n=1 Tax=Micromonospora sp. WMMD1120 TaxID=3016106 RepID=UPI0024177AE6|nr:AarF/UbiB family protein [Micromonospora sp. WMMD1120]MDG4810773.1 AarF/UbiB family protein [Micromonospora sp. WMMD1120]